MKELCNVFELYLISDVQSFSDQKIVMKPNRTVMKIIADDVNLTSKEKTEDAGLLYTIQEDLTIEKVSKSISSIFRTPRSSILCFHSNCGDDIWIGSLEFPAKVSITTHLNRDQLKLDCKSSQSLL